MRDVIDITPTLRGSVAKSKAAGSAVLRERMAASANASGPRWPLRRTFLLIIGVGALFWGAIFRLIFG